MASADAAVSTSEGDGIWLASTEGPNTQYVRLLMPRRLKALFCNQKPQLLDTWTLYGLSGAYAPNLQAQVESLKLGEPPLS